MTAKEITEKSLGKFLKNDSAIAARTSETIEKHRKGECTLTLTDKSGEPLRNKRIKLTQKSHDFKYGANIFMLDQYDTPEDNLKFRDTFHKYFNLATVPFYWAGIEPKKGELRYAADSPNIFRRPAPDLCLDYCNEKNIQAKLHCLFYDKFTPDWLPKNDSEAMRALYEKRFREIAERYKGKLYEFEVVNELMSRHSEDSMLSDDRYIIDWCFNTAKKYLPDETLVLNDGNYISAIGKKHSGFRHPYCMMVESALSRNVPIGKLGIQNHIYCGINKPFDQSLPQYTEYFDPELIINGLDILSQFGLPLEISESLIPTLGDGEWAEDLQGELFKYLYTIWFGTPQMESIVYWNIIEGSAYSSPDWDENRCGGFIFRRDFSPKPAAKVISKLFNEEWHTDTEILTDSNGKAIFKGFFGEYEAETDYVKARFALSKGKDNTLTLSI